MQCRRENKYEDFYYVLADIYHYVDYINKVDKGVALQKIILTINYFDSEDLKST